MRLLNNKLTLVMLRLYTCCFLILMMVTIPVMAAFSHCIDENLNSEQKIIGMSLSDNITSLPLLKHSKKNMQHCHTTIHCSVGLCHANYFLSHNDYSLAIATHLYFHSENALLSSFSHSPELRPPIS